MKEKLLHHSILPYLSLSWSPLHQPVISFSLLSLHDQHPSYNSSHFFLRNRKNWNFGRADKKPQSEMSRRYQPKDSYEAAEGVVKDDLYEINEERGGEAFEPPKEELKVCSARIFCLDST